VRRAPDTAGRRAAVAVPARGLMAAAAAALVAAGCGEKPEPETAPAAQGGAATVVTVGECLARAGARAVHAAAELRFVRAAVRGQVGAALDGRTTYEFLPRGAGRDEGWRVYRTRSSDAPPPSLEQAGRAPGSQEEVAALPPGARPREIRRARGCADGAPE
jgi:hypothetical protein